MAEINIMDDGTPYPFASGTIDNGYKLNIMTHTPAPWENRKGVIFVPNTYKGIATVHVRKNFDSEKWKAVEDTEAIANAKLIAAAPELLEMLNSMIEVFEPLANENNIGIDAAKRLIKKATL